MYLLISLISQNYSSAAAASSDRWGRISSAGGARWIPGYDATRPAFGALSYVMARVRSNSRTTYFGTKFVGSLSSLDNNLKASYNRKLLGIGAGPASIGGSHQGFGSNLAAYSIYHRWTICCNEYL